MSAFFPTWFNDYLRQNPEALNPASVKLVLFRQAPRFSTNDPRYLGIDSVATLGTQIGWTPPITPASNALVASTRTQGTSRYLISSNPFIMPGGFEPTNVAAMALVYNGTIGGKTDPIIMVSSTPFPDVPVFDNEDSIIARPDTVLGASSNRWLLNWVVPLAGATILPLYEGPISILKGPPTFESAHTQHCWLFPQRVNMIANPSFEGGLNHWKANGAMTRPNTAAPGGGYWSARVAGSVAESNLFPVTVGHSGTQWTIQGMIGGTGKMRVGLCSWRSEFDFLYTDWGNEAEVWDLPGENAYLHIDALRTAYDSSGYAFVRIETDGGVLTLDNILAEPGWQIDWPYFDGDSTYGSRDDYSWYGGENLKGSTYSCWYNHRRAVVGRLFAYAIAGEDPTVTDEEISEQGLVYRWVPAGTLVVPHLDVLYPNDLQSPVPDVSGAVTPYATASAPGVANPWAATQYLQPTVGTASTPNPGPFPAQCTFVYKVRGPNSVRTHGVASQFTSSPSWILYRALDPGPDYEGMTIHTTGGSNAGVTVVNNPMPTDEIMMAFSLNANDGGQMRGTVLQLLDGAWVTIGTNVVAAVTQNTSTDPVRIGAYSVASDPFDGRIYSVELRTGLDPTKGTVLWRFDATEYPGSGTTYTDPRGREWTLTAAAAIKH